MAKKSSGPKRSKPIDRALREQLKVIKELHGELTDLHEVSIMVMGDEGILPPLYGGEHLGEDREVISLWGINDDDEPELGAMLLRVMPTSEPNAELQAMRTELQLENDWPISELLDLLVMPDGQPIVDGAETLSKLSMLVALFGSQIKAAPGFDQQTMFDFVGALRPHAVFVYVPTSVEDDTLIYHWDDLEHFRAEVVYADSPQLLEAAVWEYRLNLALNAESEILLEEGADPEEELGVRDAAEWSAVFELSVMKGLRLYGLSSPVHSRQLELDVLREENGDLIVKAPLKPQVEPILILAEFRAELEAKPGEELMHLPGDGEVLQSLWPTIRASNYFGIRLRHGQFKEGPNGQLQIDGYSDNTLMDWYLTESLSDLYLQMRLAGIYEMLGTCRLVKAKALKHL